MQIKRNSTAKNVATFAIVQAARNLDLGHIILQRGLKEQNGDPKHGFAGLDVSEIAVRNGYDNFQYFPALFEATTGQSPQSF